MRKYSYIAICGGLISLLNTANAGTQGTPDVTRKWLTVEGGYDFSIDPNNVSVQSMPNVNLPDNYVSTGLGNRGFVGVGIGGQMKLPDTHISSAFSNAPRTDRLGIMYDYYAKASVSGRIDKFQIAPVYSYDFNVTSNVLWVDNQLDLIPLGTFLPFFDVALGAAWNKTSGYTEALLPGISSQAQRLQSAAFAPNTSTSFAWRVGAGGNFAIDDHWTLGIIYRYSDLGKATTGNSANYPTMGSISANITANEAVLSLRYNFDTIMGA